MGPLEVGQDLDGSLSWYSITESGPLGLPSSPGPDLLLHNQLWRRGDTRGECSCLGQHGPRVWPVSGGRYVCHGLALWSMCQRSGLWSPSEHVRTSPSWCASEAHVSYLVCSLRSGMMPERYNFPARKSQARDKSLEDVGFPSGGWQRCA